MGQRRSARGPYGHCRTFLGPVRSTRPMVVGAGQREDRADGAVCAADGSRNQPRPRLEEPSGAGRVHPRRRPERMGRLLGVLVRPGTARSAPGHGTRRHLGGRPLHVRRAPRHSGSVLSVLGCLRCRLREPRRPARHRRSGGPAQADRGDRRVHRGLSQGLHSTGLDQLGLQSR